MRILHIIVCAFRSRFNKDLNQAVGHSLLVFCNIKRTESILKSENSSQSVSRRKQMVTFHTIHKSSINCYKNQTSCIILFAKNFYKQQSNTIKIHSGCFSTTKCINIWFDLSTYILSSAKQLGIKIILKINKRGRQIIYGEVKTVKNCTFSQ